MGTNTEDEVAGAVMGTTTSPLRTGSDEPNRGTDADVPSRRELTDISYISYANIIF
jgi:hypothetical protein